MARPSCPLCGDSFSVVKLRSLARRPALPHAAAWAPPAAPGSLGRYLVLSVVAALGLYVCTGGALLCSVLALCAGVMAELVSAWDRADAYEAYRQAQARWQTAYYCSTHNRVFGVQEPFLCSPEGFARLLGTGTAAEEGVAWASSASPPAEAVVRLEGAAPGLPPEGVWGTGDDTPATRAA
jgi:hypothetical protein